MAVTSSLRGPVHLRREFNVVVLDLLFLFLLLLLLLLVFFVPLFGARRGRGSRAQRGLIAGDKGDGPLLVEEEHELLLIGDREELPTLVVVVLEAEPGEGLHPVLSELSGHNTGDRGHGGALAPLAQVEYKVLHRLPGLDLHNKLGHECSGMSGAGEALCCILVLWRGLVEHRVLAERRVAWRWQGKQVLLVFGNLVPHLLLEFLGWLQQLLLYIRLLWWCIK